MKHLSLQDLSALLDRPADDRRRREAERHLGQCPKCREALAELESQDRALATALSHDPGDAYFETFAARVQDRIRSSSRARAAPARVGLGAWLADPRRLSWVGGAAALIAAIGLVMVAAREGGIPDLRRTEVTSRAGQVAREARPSPPAAPQGDASSVPADDRQAGTSAQEERAPSAADQAPSESAPTAGELTERLQQAPRGTATPSRVVRLRRDEQTGEDVPVETGRSYDYAKPPEPAPPTSGEGRIPKPRATPLTRVPAAKGKAETFRSEAEKSSSTSALAPEDKRSNNRLMLPTPETTLQSSQLCGTVRDRDGRPVVGAQVAVADLGFTATTDGEGRYCVAAPTGRHTLTVMAVGYETVRRLLPVPLDSDQGNVVLDPVAVLGERRMLYRSQLRGQRTDLGETAEGQSFSTWPPAVAELARRAQRTNERAVLLRSASLFDRAAGEWAVALERAAGGATEIEIRARLADTRFRAWEIAPNATRRTAADQALVGYLAKAPAGTARAAAERRLERLRR